MHADTETKHAIRVREDFTGNNLFWLELSFPCERRASFADRVQECNTTKLEELLRCDMYPCCVSNKVHVSHLEIGCATHGIPAPTEGACGMQTFFPANKAFLDIFISSTNMLFLGSTLCVMSMMANSTKILIMLMDD